ncbi:c-type cytochrome [Longirhabdus pacifica]|uniref:c-type cytochrome n=1 Tax=Longirhabdus pacifica TaxID=2305227 RepID=UPI0013E8E6C2|nr:cytochrome c [Longirhabdus pacifica]
MKNMKKWAVVVGMSMILTACGGGSDDGGSVGVDTSLDTAQYGDAVKTFNNNCIGCHANDLSGVMSGSNITQVGSRLSKDEIKNVIANGQGIMPAQTQLDEEQIDQLATWLETKK